MTSIKVVAREGNDWKISRTIRSIDDANRAIRDIRSKFRQQINRDTLINLKVDRFKKSYWIGEEKYLEVALLDFPLLIECCMLSAGLLSPGERIPAVHDDVKL